MAAYKTGAFLRSKYYTPFYKTPLKWIPLSKSGALKSRPRWAAHTRIGNVWEYPPGILVFIFFTKCLLFTNDILNYNSQGIFYV